MTLQKKLTPEQQREVYGLALLDGRAPMPGEVTRADVIEWLKRCGAAMGQAEDMTPKPLQETTQ